MKVIFLPNNTASLASVHIPALRSLGVEAVGYNFSPLKINDTSVVNNWPQQGSNLSLKKAVFIFNFVSDLLSSDVIHWMYGGNSKLTKVALFFITHLRKKKFVEFSGTDIRSLEKLCDDVEFYKFEEFSEHFKCIMGVSKTSLESQNRFRKAGFYPLPSYPELIEYIDPSIFPKYSLISRSVNLDLLVPIPHKNPLPLIVHAPSNPEVKGTKYVLDAAEKLKKAGLADFRLISNMTHKEALQLLMDADIVVDQIVAGDYGVLAIESMALSKPVVCFIRPKVLAYYQKHFDNFPIVNANIHNIYEVLESLVSDKIRIETLSKASSAYASKYHDPKKNAAHLIYIYEQLS